MNSQEWFDLGVFMGGLFVAGFAIATNSTPLAMLGIFCMYMGSRR